MTVIVPMGSVFVSAMVVGLKLIERQKMARFRQQTIFIKGIRQAENSLQRPRVHASASAQEMEQLLAEIRTAADLLVCALSTEEGLRRMTLETGDPSQSERLQTYRERAEQLQAEYYDTVERYREFVQSLAPPLRAKAAERGQDVMTLACV
jgi:hypothetical protein